MEPSCDLSCTPSGARLTLRGDFDIAARILLIKNLTALDHVPSARIAINAQGVTFIDVGCARLLAQAQRRLRTRGVDLSVEAASPRFQLVARWGRFDGLRTTHESHPTGTRLEA